MREGLLWYDPDPPRPAAEKIAGAARRFRERFGAALICCPLHPDADAGEASVHVVTDPRILPHHYWIGVDDTLPVPRAAQSVAPRTAGRAVATAQAELSAPTAARSSSPRTAADAVQT